MFKASNSFDIFDPETKEHVMQCREENLGFFTKLFRFTDYKRMTPFDIDVKTFDGKRIVKVKRGATFMFSKVDVIDEAGTVIGKFKQKFTIPGSAAFPHQATLLNHALLMSFVNK